MIRSGITRLQRVNVSLLVVTAALLAYGTLMVSSAVSGMDGGPGMMKRHLLGIGIGLVLMGVAWAIDYQRLSHWTGPLLIGLALLLVAPMIPGLGNSAKGANAWLSVGGVTLFQPSEPGKLIFIVVLAAVVARFKGSIESARDLLPIFGFTAIPFLIILAQNDLGTALVFIAILAAMLLVGGMRGRYFLAFALIGVIAVGGVLQFGLLQKYQEDRLLVFVDPTRDPQGAGYNLQQSKIAIGSGELFGKGRGSGTQSNLNFLPERHTDFIFSVLGEELGFAGGVVLLALYLGVLATALAIATSSRDLYGALVVAGLIGMWSFQILENIGMTVGIMPITGIPLPFMSYGSSFMVTNLAAIGVLQSVWSRRYGT